jgi:hypothetical protein
MAFDSKIRKLWAILTIPAVLRAIGAGYERGGLSGLRDLATDILASVGLYSRHRRSPRCPPRPALQPPSPPTRSFGSVSKTRAHPACLRNF